MAEPLLQALADAIDARLGSVDEIRWPCDRWQTDPAGFAREVLGRELTSQQVEIADAIVAESRVAVRASQKVGKSDVAAILALWYYCSYPDARVILVAPSDAQINNIIWRYVKKFVVEARRRGYDLGEAAKRAQTGLRSADFREIVGRAAKEPEAMAGISGSRLFFIVDEATGVSDDIFEAIEGNCAAGASTRLLVISNPTKSYGYFARCFLERPEHWHLIHLSSLQSPNVLAGRIVVPGLADPEWIAERKEEWGEDSPFYKTRVLGEFVLNEQGRVIDYNLIVDAEQRWDSTPAEGQLSIGVDPAGPGGDGDETVFAVVRGQKLLALWAFRGLDAEGIREQLSTLLKQHRKPNETPHVGLDAGGAVGEPVAKKLIGWRNAVERGEHAFTLTCWRANKPARNPAMYHTIRDELHANAAKWLRDGGAIPPDNKLERELLAPEWHQYGATGASKVTRKEDIRSMLGRSPDRADAFMLAVMPRPGMGYGPVPVQVVDNRPADQIWDPHYHWTQQRGGHEWTYGAPDGGRSGLGA